MKFKAFLCLCLCFAFALSLFVGCGETLEPGEGSKTGVSGTESGVPQPGESSVGEGDDPYVDESGIYSAKNLPPFKEEWRDYKTFRVLVCSDEVQKTYYNEEIEPLYDTTDDAIVEGVVRRNDWISDTYGITVKAVPVPGVLTVVRTEITGGVDTFDAALPFMSACATLAREGALFDLYEFSDILCLEAPWWDQNASAAASVGNKLYFTASDMSIMQKIVSSGIVFNKDLIKNYFPNFNIYDEVDNGTWTLDQLYAMCKEITTNLVDEEVMDENDLWGILDTGPSFFYGCGESLAAKDANNYPIIALGSTTRSTDVAQKVLELSAETKTWMATVADWTDKSDIYGTIVEVFGQNRALFMALHFSAVKKLRPYGVNYGIVPAAKFNKEQDDYYTKCSAAYANGVCIPLCVKDPEFSAYMCELMAIGGKNYVSGTYYNVVLKSKDLVDEDSERMLDIIFDNIVYDPAVIYGFAGLNDLLPNLIAAKSTDIASRLDSIKINVEDDIQKLIDAFES